MKVSAGSRQNLHPTTSENWKNNRFGGESILNTEHAHNKIRVALGGEAVITRHCHLLKKEGHEKKKAKKKKQMEKPLWYVSEFPTE